MSNEKDTKQLDVRLSTTQVEELTGVSSKQVARLCKQGLVPHSTVQNKNRIIYKVLLSDIDKVVAASNMLKIMDFEASVPYIGGSY